MVSSIFSSHCKVTSEKKDKREILRGRKKYIRNSLNIATIFPPSG